MTIELEQGVAPLASLPAGVLESAFRCSPVGMAIVAPDGAVAAVNDALCAMVGYTPTELCRFGMAALVHEDDADTELETRRRLLAGACDIERGELRLRHKRGRTVWTQLTRTLARAPNGEPLHFVDQLQDLTEQRRAEKEVVLLNNLLEQRIRRRTLELEESNDDLRGFAYSIAHDLRAPLASIDGFSAQLERVLDGQLGERARHYLRRVRAGVSTMSELTDGLLALADISRAELVRIPVDLSAIARGVLERLAEQQPDRKVAVDVAPTPPVSGDPRLLTNVMENLLGNAWKFTAKTRQARISFGVEGTGGGACYFVSDNGAGFDPAAADKLFTPFQRLHNDSDFPGTGIGLALVRKIVSRHGGQLWAEGRPGEGACFRFTLAA